MMKASLLCVVRAIGYESYLNTQTGEEIPYEKLLEKKKCKRKFANNLRMKRYIAMPTSEPYLRKTFFEKHTFSEQTLEKYGIDKECFENVTGGLIVCSLSEDRSINKSIAKMHCLFEDLGLEREYKMWARIERKRMALEWLAHEGIAAIDDLWY